MRIGRLAIIACVVAAVVALCVWWLPDGGSAPDAPQGDPQHERTAPELMGLPTPEPEPAVQEADATTEARSGYELDKPPHAQAEKEFVGEPVPATALEAILVDAEGRPLAEGMGLLWRMGRDERRGHDATPVSRPATRTVRVTRDGLIRFDDLEDDMWTIGFRLDDGVTRAPVVARETGRSPSKRMTLHLGTEEVYGSVYDADGLAAAGAAVRVYETSNGAVAQATTDATGRYRIGSLRNRTLWMAVALNANWNDPAQVSTRSVRMATESGPMEVNFGSPAGTVWIRGTVQCADGVPVRGPGSILLRRAPTFFPVPYDETGAFARRIPTGEYHLQISLPNGTQVDQQEFRVVERDMERVVLVVRGTRLQGTVRTSNGKPVPAGTTVEARRGATLVPTGFTVLTRRGSRITSPGYPASVAADGTFVLYGVPVADSLIVRARGYAVRSVPIQFDEHAAAVTQDITLEPLPAAPR